MVRLHYTASCLHATHLERIADNLAENTELLQQLVRAGFKVRQCGGRGAASAACGRGCI